MHQEIIAHETLVVSVTLMNTLSEGSTATVGAAEKVVVNVVSTY